MVKTIKEQLDKLKEKKSKEQLENIIIPELKKTLKNAHLKDKIEIYKGIIKKSEKGYIKGIEPPEIFFTLSEIYEKKGKYTEQIENLEYAMEEYMKDTLYQDHKKAISVGIKLLGKKPNNPKILEKIGKCQKEIENPGDAIKTYKRAADIYLKNNNIMKAEGCYEEVLALQEGKRPHKETINTMEQIKKITNDKEKIKSLEKRIKEMKTELLLERKDIIYNIKELDTVVVKEIEIYIKNSDIEPDKKILENNLNKIIREIDSSHKRYIKNTMKIEKEGRDYKITAKTMSVPNFGYH